MQYSHANIFWGRDDTSFGVCAAIGEDFGFNPLFLRIGFAAFLFFNPMAAIGGYVALGVVVLFSRLVAPNPRLASEPAVSMLADTAELAPAGNQMELALAA